MQHHNSPANETVIPENTGFKGWIRTNKTKFVFASAIFLAVLTTLLTSLSASDADAASICDRYASPKGSNTNSGTLSKPYHTAQKLADSLRPGQKGCLRAGVYTEGDKLVSLKSGGTSNNQRLIIQNYPGEKATIKAGVKVNSGAEYVTFRSVGGLWNLTLDGTGGPVSPGPTNQGRVNTDPSPFIQASHTRWVGLNITKGNQWLPSGQLYKTGVCVYVGNPDSAVRDTVITKGRIHGCGVRANQEDNSYIPNYFGPGKNLDNRRSGSPDNHGFYIKRVAGVTRIMNNLIYNNGERGVQLYPQANGVLVSGNVIHRNGTGLAINEKSSNNIVRNNVFSNAQGGSNVNQGPKLSGRGNRVNSNCFWMPKRSSGFNHGSLITASRNVVASPRYRSFKVTNSTCLAKYNGTLARR